MSEKKMYEVHATQMTDFIVYVEADSGVNAAEDAAVSGLGDWNIQQTDVVVHSADFIDPESDERFPDFVNPRAVEGYCPNCAHCNQL